MAKTFSCILVGLDVIEVEIETIVSFGFSGLNILGLSSNIAKDMKERIRTALEYIGIPVPAKRVIVNLSPAHFFKLSRTQLQELDFAVAASIILALFEEQGIKLPEIEKEFFAGELTLTAQLRSVQNSLVYEKIAHSHKDNIRFAISKFETCTPHDHFEFYDSLLNWLNSRKYANPAISINNHDSLEKKTLNFTDLEINKTAQAIKTLLKNPKLCVALLVAAAGNHHILIAGEPGIGKTFSIHKIKQFLKPLSFDEQISIQLIHSNKTSTCHRPFRSPHHSASVAALIGGQSLKPGEVTMAHNGILFLDEIAEFSRNALEALREPLDSYQVELSKSAGTVRYPAKFLLCATTNPCPCGYFLSKIKPCRCFPHESKKYISKISGPLLDRFHLKIWVENTEDLSEKLDLFSEYLMSLDENQMLEFSKNFLSLQYQIENEEQNDFAPLFPEHLHIPKHIKTQISMRAQNQLEHLIKTFFSVFPNLQNKNNFTDEILKYRNFSQMLETDFIS